MPFALVIDILGDISIAMFFVANVVLIDESLARVKRKPELSISRLKGFKLSRNV